MLCCAALTCCSNSTMLIPDISLVPLGAALRLTPPASRPALSLVLEYIRIEIKATSAWLSKRSQCFGLKNKTKLNKKKKQLKTHNSVSVALISTKIDSLVSAARGLIFFFFFFQIFLRNHGRV